MFMFLFPSVLFVVSAMLRSKLLSSLEMPPDGLSAGTCHDLILDVSDLVWKQPVCYRSTCPGCSGRWSQICNGALAGPLAIYKVHFLQGPTRPNVPSVTPVANCSITLFFFIAGHWTAARMTLLHSAQGQRWSSVDFHNNFPPPALTS